MDIITQLFQKVDSVAASAIQQIYQSLSQGLLPVFTIALTIYVAYWGYEMIYGRAPLTAGAFIWRVVRIALIYSLAFGWSDFSTIVVGTFTHGADGVASAVCTGVGGTNCGTPETSVSSTLSTLLTNALNYTPTGGEVLIKTILVQEDGNPQAGFSVEDTGLGISAEDMPHLFERFYRGGAARQSGAPGTGLGLAIVKQVVDHHGGRIEVQNGADGHGTKFTVWLPVKQKQETD